MTLSHYRRLETALPAQSGAGIALFAIAILLPVMLIAVAVHLLG